MFIPFKGRLFFFPKENLSIILFVVIILTKKINEAVIEKMMPAKIRSHLKLYSWEVWTSAFNSATVDPVSNNNTKALCVSMCVHIEGKGMVNAEISYH